MQTAQIIVTHTSISYQFERGEVIEREEREEVRERRGEIVRGGEREKEREG